MGIHAYLPLPFSNIQTVMARIPGGFYCFICSTYIANAKIGFNIPWTYAYIIGVAAAVLYVGVIIWYGRKRAAAHTLQH